LRERGRVAKSHVMAGLVPAMTVIKAVSYMRAEIENLVEEIKQSVGLLRRHL
jgi:hypothetical protein